MGDYIFEISEGKRNVMLGLCLWLLAFGVRLVVRVCARGEPFVNEMK